jgi:hypothetical protein
MSSWQQYLGRWQQASPDTYGYAIFGVAAVVAFRIVARELIREQIQRVKKW